jgi:HAMP domain-containing protein
MTLRRTVELVAFALALLIAAMALHAWLVSRQSALAQTLAQIENLKRATQTPQQIVSAIPQFISLPQPITLTPTQQGIQAPNATARFPNPGTSDTSKPSPSSGANRGADSSDAALPSAPTAQIPTADLKPLYNYIQDCRSCQAQLASAQQNAADDASKIEALTKERDAAVTASKGGTIWRRLSRNALWFALGAAATLAATKVPTHAHPNPTSTNLRQTPPNPITLQ